MELISKLWTVLIAIAVGLLALGGSLYVLRPWAGPSSTGQLAVEVHDAPCDGCSHVWVSFSAVAVHRSNSSGDGWTSWNVSSTALDLMALNGTAFAKTIGVASLAAGHYEQVRLTVVSAVVGLSNGTNVTARVPAATSADAHGPFNVSAGGTTTISIDIDLQTSLHVVVVGETVMATFTPNIGSVVVVG